MELGGGHRTNLSGGDEGRTLMGCRGEVVVRPVNEHPIGVDEVEPLTIRMPKQGRPGPRLDGVPPHVWPAVSRQLLDDTGQYPEALDVDAAFTATLEEHLMADTDPEQGPSLANPTMHQVVPTHGAQACHAGCQGSHSGQDEGVIVEQSSRVTGNRDGGTGPAQARPAECRFPEPWSMMPTRTGSDIEGTLGAGDTPGIARIRSDGNPQSAGQSLVLGLADVVGIPSGQQTQVHAQASIESQ